jgi:hypothetical protein
MHKLDNPPRAITIYEEKAELGSNMEAYSSRGKNKIRQLTMQKGAHYTY